MWTQVQKMLNRGGEEKEISSNPPIVPLRKPQVRAEDIGPGKTIHFSATCPLKPLSGARGYVEGVRHYRFGADEVVSFQLNVAGQKQYYLTVAEDDEGTYLALSRALSAAEQDQWFGRDALGFFTEASSAKSIRCKADLESEAAWAAGRYAKTVDWAEGSVSQGEPTRLMHMIHYNLLVNEAGDKALEIEHEDASGENRVLITVYRPMSDISSVELTIDQPPALTAIPANDDIPLFKEPVMSAAPKARPDFRRIEETNEPIHIERTPPSLVVEKEEPTVDLPSFLVPKEGNYLALDEVIPPEAEKVRVGLAAARNLIDQAQRKQVRVRDVLREMIGLESALSEEVIFELPLSDEDYRTLAMRYKLRPDHRIEIRSRLEEELRTKLGAQVRG